MKLKFLGINGFELQANGKTLLIDPYVTRDRDRLSVPAVVRKHIKEADYIFLGHSHWDHAADVAEIAIQLRGIKCDYLLAGISGRAPDYLPRLLACVRAKTLIPAHWDNFAGHPVEDPGERVDMKRFHEEMKELDSKQNIKVLKVLETMELQTT